MSMSANTNTGTSSGQATGLASMLPPKIGLSDFISFTFKGKDYDAIINNIDNNILAITLMPSWQQLKFYYSNGIWLVENRYPATNVRFSKNSQEAPIPIEEKIDFTGSRLSDLNVLILLKDPEFNALCRTNQHLGQLCRNPALQKQIYKERILVHMPEAMKYVTNGNYKEVYQAIRDIEQTQLFVDISVGYWNPVEDDYFERIPHRETIEKIFKDDNIIGLRHLIDSDDDNEILNMLNHHNEVIPKLLAENGATEILDWLITSGEWEEYYTDQAYGSFDDIVRNIVIKGLAFGTPRYVENLVQTGIYTGDPNNPLPEDLAD